MSSESAKSAGTPEARKGPVTGLIGGLIQDAQDAVTSGPTAPSGLGTLIDAAVRQVTDVETIKALADPTRLAILRALMSERDRAARVMSAKELAGELGEPQTKLYRHLKVLEAQGLIRVAETRVVSGIVETRYRSGQSALSLDPDDLDLDEVGEQVLEVASAGIDAFRRQFVAQAARGGVPFGPDVPLDHRKGLIVVSSTRIPEARADEFRARFGALIDDFTAEPSDAAGVPVEVLIGWFSPEE